MKSIFSNIKDKINVRNYFYFIHSEINTECHNAKYEVLLDLNFMYITCNFKNKGDTTDNIM